jgi:hypothetical protein
MMTTWTDPMQGASADLRALSGDERSLVSGGMKWTRGHKSPNVIDARGGSTEMFGLTITFDIHGNVSSVSVPPKT